MIGIKHTLKMTERQKIVAECIIMRLTNEQSLEYLKLNGFSISQPTLTRDKKVLNDLKMERLFEIAQVGFEDQHIARIENTELALKLLWNSYHAENNNFKRVLILEKIVAIQPYLSSFYESTKRLIERNPEIKMKLEAMYNLAREAKTEIKSNNGTVTITKSDGYNRDQDTNNTSDGTERINQPSEEHVRSGISTDGEGGQSGRETSDTGTSQKDAEDYYRRQKERGIL